MKSIMEPVNFAILLTELRDWLGSDYKVAEALTKILDIPSNYRGTLQKMRTGKVREPSHSVGEAILHLHRQEAEKRARRDVSTIKHQYN